MTHQIIRLRKELEGTLHVLQCIANMQYTEATDTIEVLNLCVSMARLELEKIRTECSAEGELK